MRKGSLCTDCSRKQGHTLALIESRQLPLVGTIGCLLRQSLISMTLNEYISLNIKGAARQVRLVKTL